MFVINFLKKVVYYLLWPFGFVWILFEELAWTPLAALIKSFHLRRIEAWISSLPPYGALCAFALPAITLIPFKLVAVYLFATGYYMLGLTVLITAKLVGTALVARIFQLTSPQLLTIGWFARLHGWVTAQVHAVKERIKAPFRKVWVAIKEMKLSVKRFFWSA